MSHQRSRPCPVCDDVRFDVLHPTRFATPEGYPLPDACDVVCCQRCGMVYANSPATQADYDRYYAWSSKYEDTTTTTGAGELGWDAERLATTARTIAAHVPDRTARIVDVGCAAGGQLTALAALGYTNLCGIDPSPRCAEMTRARGFEGHTGAIATLPEGLPPADLVILNNVLEHLLDTRGAVAALSTLLRPGGCLYLEVPDAEGYAPSVVSPFQDFNTEHINHFSLRCLSALVQSLGFVPVAEGRSAIQAEAFATPVIWGIWRLAPEGREPYRFEKDSGLEASARAYIAASIPIFTRMRERLERLAHEESSVVVWGVGQLMMKLLRETALGTMPIAAFVDGNPINHGKVFRGVRVEAPSVLARHPEPVLIATVLHEAAITRAIRDTLRLPNRILSLR